MVCAGNYPALDVVALAAQRFQPLYGLGDWNPWIRPSIEKQQRDIGRQHSGDRVIIQLPSERRVIRKVGCVGHVSKIKPRLELLRIPLEAVASYALGLIYASTSVLVEKQKKLGGFDAHKFRQDFLASCRERGYQITLRNRAE